MDNIEDTPPTLQSTALWTFGTQPRHKPRTPDSLYMVRNAWAQFLTLTGFPSKRRRPSICIWTLTRSVGLAISCAHAPHVPPTMTDFLQNERIRQKMIWVFRAWIWSHLVCWDRTQITANNIAHKVTRLGRLAYNGFRQLES